MWPASYPLKKMRSIAIADARARLKGDTSKPRITEITPREWEAIQSGAVTKSMLRDIIDNSDQDMIKELATPRKSKSDISEAKKNRIKALAASGKSQSEIAKALGVSVSTVNKYS